MGKNIKNITYFSAIIHVTFSRNLYRDKVNNFDLFTLDSLIVGRKLDFPTMALGHMKLGHSTRHIKTLH